ncbi:hypothetical protein Tco_0984934, partial [Tanacetum coccineum]
MLLFIIPYLIYPAVKSKGVSKLKGTDVNSRARLQDGKIVTTSRCVVLTGRVKVLAGRYVVPTGKDNLIVSTGRSNVIPAGSTILV